MDLVRFGRNFTNTPVARGHRVRQFRIEGIGRLSVRMTTQVIFELIEENRGGLPCARSNVSEQIGKRLVRRKELRIGLIPQRRANAGLQQ